MCIIFLSTPARLSTRRLCDYSVYFFLSCFRENIDYVFFPILHIKFFLSFIVIRNNYICCRYNRDSFIEHYYLYFFFPFLFDTSWLFFFSRCHSKNILHYSVTISRAKYIGHHVIMRIYVWGTHVCIWLFLRFISSELPSILIKPAIYCFPCGEKWPLNCRLWLFNCCNMH